jgi:hypothetical protein
MNQPTEKPILFSTEMVRAILENRKTQTRRIIKPQPYLADNGQHWMWDSPKCAAMWAISETPLLDGCSPYGKPGERLWVRETWCKTDDGIEYRADVKDVNAEETARVMADYGYKWKPSTHMARKDSRILLEVASVRAERLQTITEADAIAEGIEVGEKSLSPGNPFCVMNAKYLIRRYAGLWNSINGRVYPWTDNPWVWVVEFKTIESEDGR